MSAGFLKIWSDTEYVYRCLVDRERTLAFQSAINKVVKPGDVVLDLGTGSGIMALFAAKAGARRVVAVEISDYLSTVARESFEANGFGDTIKLLHMDSRAVKPEDIDKPDVVICENVTTGLIGEPQGPVINSLKRSGVIDHKTILIPAGLSTSLRLVNINWEFYGIKLFFPVFVDYFTKSFERPYEKLSDEVTAHRVNFSSDFSEEVNIEATLHVSHEGVVNGILLSSITDFVGEGQLGSCVSYCQPVILPVREVKVSEKSVATVAIQYRMGRGFDSLKYNVDITGKTSI